MEIKIIKEKITKGELVKTAKESFGEMVKGAVDIERRVIALGGELHIDTNERLIKDGSSQQNIWGINIYPNNPRDEWIEFNSLINIKPALGNRSADIKDENVREKIKEIVNELIE